MQNQSPLINQKASNQQEAIDQIPARSGGNLNCNDLLKIEEDSSEYSLTPAKVVEKHHSSSRKAKSDSGK